MYPAFTSTSQVNPVWNAMLGVLGGAIGGIAGYFITGWLTRQGFYAMILPGALAGLGGGASREQERERDGGGAFVRRRSVPAALLCGLIALLAGGAAEWRFHPFIADASLGYFLSHLNEFKPVTYLMLLAGGLFGFWFALGGAAKAVRPTAPEPTAPA